ncbi:N-lysine methyltransferase SMYD2 [Camelus ferus]|nr:N-lysine methyltransferase SMYD2 [Camelus ferus]
MGSGARSVANTHVTHPSDLTVAPGSGKLCVLFGILRGCRKPCKQLMSLVKGIKSGTVHVLDHDRDSRANWGALDSTEAVYQPLPLIPDLAANDLDKLDNEKKDLIQSDIAALHHFYSKHLEFPDNDSLVVLFAQVRMPASGISVALMNHSCCPNVIVTYKGTLAEVRAVQEIHPGEEVFTSYIDLLYPTEDRNDRLRDSYFFTCECRECTTKDKDKAKVEIRKLSDPPKAEAIRDMVRYARNVIEEFRRAKHYKYILHGRPSPAGGAGEAPPSELLEICELSQEKMSCMFEDSNVYMLHMMYQAMGVCLYMQDWEGALRYGQKIIQPYREKPAAVESVVIGLAAAGSLRLACGLPAAFDKAACCVFSASSKHYPLYSLNVASMWLKLGRLYLGLENRAAGEKALKKVPDAVVGGGLPLAAFGSWEWEGVGLLGHRGAIAIMEVAHGKDHPYISEIKQEIESH